MKYFPAKPKLATWYHNWMMTSPALNGRTVFAVTNEGGNCHESQSANNWCAPGHVFDLLDSKVGTDSAFNDLFEHLDTTVYFKEPPTGIRVKMSASDQHIIYTDHSLKIPNRTAVSERPSMEIRSLSGTLIASPLVTFASGGWEAKLDAITTSPGIYLAIVHYDGKRITRRITRR
jgi:hypothetical protein